jgi:hypothetical protein
VQVAAAAGSVIRVRLAWSWKFESWAGCCSSVAAVLTKKFLKFFYIKILVVSELKCCRTARSRKWDCDSD